LAIHLQESLSLVVAMRITALLTAALAGAVGATELTKETWDDAVAGKTVFIKFQAPW
jgi:hypothetical protein